MFGRHPCHSIKWHLVTRLLGLGRPSEGGRR